MLACADNINLLDVSSVHEFEHWIKTIVECLLDKVQLEVKVQVISLSNLSPNIYLCQMSPAQFFFFLNAAYNSICIVPY